MPGDYPRFRYFSNRQRFMRGGVNFPGAAWLHCSRLECGRVQRHSYTFFDLTPDVYCFASDKPLTLLNGANLLHPLERHGYQAQIDRRCAIGMRMNLIA
jgi:hypothetical protein